MTQGQYFDDWKNDGFRIKVRCQRNMANLVNAYHDIVVPRIHSWKKHRHSQYHVKRLE